MASRGFVLLRAPAQVARELADRYASAANVLIDAGNGWAGALIICCGIDVFAALYAGRTAQLGSAPDFVTFAKKYMEVFRPPPPEVGHMTYVEPEGEVERRGGQLAWTSAPHRPVDSCAEILYRGYRCGLIHEGFTAPGLTVVDKKGSIFVLQIDQLNGQAAFRMDLNVRPFRDCFLRATQKYARDLEDDHELLGRFRLRWSSVTGPQWMLIEP